METATTNKILKAKIRLQKDSPFFSFLVANLKISENKDIPTMAVDNKNNCFYNSDFVNEIELNELEGVLCHEVMHIVLEHLVRGAEVESHILMNVAQDMVINDLIVNNGFKLPRAKGENAVDLIPRGHSCKFMGVRVDNLDKKTAVQVYYELLKNIKTKDIKYSGFDIHIISSKNGDGKDKNSQTNEEIQQGKEEWKRIVGGASALAREKGNVPQGLQLLIDDLLYERVDWKQLLYKYITRTLPFDYTYARPSKKSVSCGVYMPSVLRESIEIIVSIDTSGSINKDELTEFMTEIRAIENSFANINMKLIVCDWDIKNVYSIGSGQEDDIDNIILRGGGGTSHLPVYEFIRNELPSAQFLINFTDGYTEFPDEEEIKTLWVLNKDGCDERDIPFGEVIKLG